MKKKLIRAAKDTTISLVVALLVQFTLSYLYHSEMFTNRFILFLIVFVISSIVFKVLLKRDVE